MAIPNRADGFVGWGDDWRTLTAFHNALEGRVYQPPTTPRPVIFDTDWYSDIDDAVAARIVAHGERVGLVDIRAAILDTKYAKGPGSLDAFFTAEGHPGMPIGVVSASGAVTGAQTYQDPMFDTLPHREGHPAACMDSTEVYRRALAAAADGTVDIISVGLLTALSELLASPGDSISSLTGPQLVTAKVRHLWVMGGAYPSGTEFNFQADTTATTRVCTSWPTPITFLGFEVGNTVITGQGLAGLSASDVLSKALVDSGYGTSGRSSWDPMLTWMACLGDPTTAGYAVVNGAIATDGQSFTPGVGNHRYVVKTRPDFEYAADLNARITPNRDPAPVALPRPAGQLLPVVATRVPAAATFTRPARNAAANLLVQYHADDLRDLADGATVSHLVDRKLATPARQTASGSRPAVATVGGVRALNFASGKYLASDPIALPSTFTVYALVRWATLPSGAQTLFAADSSFSLTGRIFHLTGTTSGTVQGIGYTPAGAARTDAAGAATVNTWQVVAARITSTEVETYLGGVSTGGATASAGQNSGLAQLAIGSRYWDTSSEPFVGYLRDLRIYGAGHDSSTVATVSAEMLNPPAFNPATISGLAAWYDPSDTATLWTDTAGTTAATTADAVVARIDDKSGNGRHATQSTSSARPLLKLAVQNGKNALYFDGAGDYLLTPINPSTVLTEELTILCVGRLDDTTARTWSWIYGDNATGGTGLFFGKADGENRVHFAASGWHNGVWAFNTNSGMDGAWHQYGQQESDVASRALVDGIHVYNAIGSNSSMTRTTLCIGGRGPNEGWKGWVGPTLIWNRILTTAERQQVEAGLRAGWATP